MFKITCTGYLAADPELRYQANGNAILNFRIGVSTGRKNKEGGWDDHTDWVRVTTMRGVDSLNEKLTKGTRVLVVGRLSTGEYEAKDGSGKRFSLDVFADDVEIQPRTPEQSSEQNGREPTPIKKPVQRAVAPADDEDLPFRSPRFLDDPWLYWKCP